MTEAYIMSAKTNEHTFTRFDDAMRKLDGKDIAGQKCIPAVKKTIHLLWTEYASRLSVLRLF